MRDGWPTIHAGDANKNQSTELSVDSQFRTESPERLIRPLGVIRPNIVPWFQNSKNATMVSCRP